MDLKDPVWSASIATASRDVKKRNGFITVLLEKITESIFRGWTNVGDQSRLELIFGSLYSGEQVGMDPHVILRKAASIQKCIGRIREEYAALLGRPLDQDFLRQDSIVLNLQRACEASIDGALLLIRETRGELPDSAREAFLQLAKAGLLGETQAQHLAKMVGFRNLAVHDYQSLNIEIVESIIKSRLEDLEGFARLLIQTAERLSLKQ